MPLFNWIKCTDGNIKYVSKECNGTSDQNLKNWNRLYDEYLDRFGLGKRYEKYLKAQQKLGILQADYIIKREKFLLNLIEIERAKLSGLEAFFSTGQKIEVILLWLGKFMGYRIDAKKTSVLEYFTLLEEYGKANKKK